MLVLVVITFFVQFSNTAYISEVFLEQTSPFPIELGNRIEWKVSPKSGNAYDSTGGINIFLEDKVIGSWTPECVSYLDKLARQSTSCEVGRGPFLSFFFVPLREHFGKRIKIIFYPNSRSIFTQTGQILLNTTIQLTKQPTFLDLSLTLEREPDYVKYAPPELLLAPPTFLDGSMARLECKTDGALPPAPISFSIVCDNPPRATVELDRQSKAQIGHPYEISYAYYHFRSPPTDEELAERIAIRNARSIIEESRIARSQDNLTLSVSLPVNSRAHDCSLYCRLMGKERQVRLTVYYQTTVAYILPSPTDGLMRVGSSVTCYADGYPEPSISLSLRQPMHQYQRRPIIDPKEYIVTTSPSPPVDEFEDKSDVAVATRIGLRPDEYTIRGARFSLAYNATPGVELLLVCSAGNALPNSLNFLGYNKTIAVARFTVAAISYSSIGIVVGICLSILLVAILVILLMIYLRRRQKYASNAIQTRNAASVGANGAKVGRGPPPGGFGKQGTHAGSGDYPSSTKTNRMLYEIRSSLVDDGEESPRLGLLAANSQSASSPPPPTSTMSEGDAIEYAELTFPADQTPGRRAPFHASATLGRRSSGCRPTRKPTPGPSTSGAGSASMQQLPRSHTQDNDDAEGNYTEIVGVMQPKAYTSQLVLKQQQEATKAILGMNSNAQSVFV